MATGGFVGTHPSVPHAWASFRRGVALFGDPALRVRFALVIMFGTDSRRLYPCLSVDHSCHTYTAAQLQFVDTSRPGRDIRQYGFRTVLGFVFWINHTAGLSGKTHTQ